MTKDTTHSESEWLDLLEQTPDALFVSDARGFYIHVNQATCDMLGYSRDELLRMSVRDLLSKDQLYRLEQTRQSLLRGAGGVGEWRMRRKDGSFVDVEVSAKILPDGRWQGFARDVSERLELERVRRDEQAFRERVVAERARDQEALRISEERLRLSLRATPLFMSNQDLDLRYTWVHYPAQAEHEASPVGKTDFDLMPHDEAETLTALKRQALALGVGLREVVRVTMAGRTMHFDLTIEPMRAPSGEIIGVTSAAWNVTDQRHTEQKLRLLAELGSTLMTITQDYSRTLQRVARLFAEELADVAVVDVVERGTRLRKVACTSPEDQASADAMARLTKERITSDELAHALPREPSLSKWPNAMQLRNIAQCADEAKILLELAPRAVLRAPLFARDRVVGALSLFAKRPGHNYGERDLQLIAEVARATAMAVDNAQLYRAATRAIAERDAILGVVAHDLRSPLNTLIMQTQLLRHAHGDVDARLDKGLSTIERAGRRMSRMIEDLLDLERLESSSLPIEQSPISPSKLLEEVTEAQSPTLESAGLRLQVDQPSELPEICGDRDRLLQIFDNLIGNALKFTPRGGSVRVHARAQQDSVVFSIIDDGPGIPPQQQQKIFDRHYQAEKSDRRGAGLGLAIVKGLVEGHGGKVWVESDGKHGTTFRFSIPLANGASRSSKPELHA